MTEISNDQKLEKGCRIFIKSLSECSKNWLIPTAEETRLCSSIIFKKKFGFRTYGCVEQLRIIEFLFARVSSIHEQHQTTQRVTSHNSEIEIESDNSEIHVFICNYMCKVGNLERRESTYRARKAGRTDDVEVRKALVIIPTE